MVKLRKDKVLLRTGIGYFLYKMFFLVQAASLCLNQSQIAAHFTNSSEGEGSVWACSLSSSLDQKKVKVDQVTTPSAAISPEDKMFFLLPFFLFSPSLFL